METVSAEAVSVEAVSVEAVSVEANDSQMTHAKLMAPDTATGMVMGMMAATAPPPDRFQRIFLQEERVCGYTALQSIRGGTGTTRSSGEGQREGESSEMDDGDGGYASDEVDEDASGGSIEEGGEEQEGGDKEECEWLRGEDLEHT